MSEKKYSYDAGPSLRPTSFWNSGSSCRQSRSESLAAQFWLPYPAANAFLKVSSASALLPNDAVGARGVVESVGVAGSQGDGGLQVPDAFVRVFFEVGELRSQQDAGAHVFGHDFQLLAEDLDHSLPQVLRLLFSSQPFERHAEGM